MKNKLICILLVMPLMACNHSKDGLTDDSKSQIEITEIESSKKEEVSKNENNESSSQASKEINETENDKTNEKVTDKPVESAPNTAQTSKEAPEPAPISPAPVAPNNQQGLPENVHSSDWNLILINDNYAIPSGFQAPLVNEGNGNYFDSRLEEDYRAMVNAAASNGIYLFFASGYRSIELQASNVQNTINNYLNSGYNQAEAENLAFQYLMPAGHSEHHTGLALDIIDHVFLDTGKSLHTDFQYTAAYTWLMNNIADYGFILRYPAGKESITNVNFEPWHFRYVGAENARYIQRNGLTLEEYIQLLWQREG